MQSEWLLTSFFAALQLVNSHSEKKITTERKSKKNENKNLQKALFSFHRQGGNSDLCIQKNMKGVLEEEQILFLFVFSALCASIQHERVKQKYSPASWCGPGNEAQYLWGAGAAAGAAGGCGRRS